MQFDEVLRTWKGFFEKEEIRYVLIGGMAMKAWGRVRLTKDVDFAVDRANQPGVVSFAESLGYETLHVSEAFSNHAHDDTRYGRVDFMYLSGETAERIFSASQTKTIVGDESLPVASAEHLAMMKAVAMKNFPQRALFEGEDVRLLLNVPGVDRAAIREYYQRQGLLELYDAIAKVR
jgi:hypothetical protein